MNILKKLKPLKTNVFRGFFMLLYRRDIIEQDGSRSMMSGKSCIDEFL